MANKNTNNNTNKENLNIQIQKPISLVVKEEKEKLVNVLNNINLHPVLLEMIVKEIYLDVQNQAKYVSEREMQEYIIQSANAQSSVSEE
jgi:hypothetical protein